MILWVNTSRSAGVKAQSCHTSLRYNQRAKGDVDNTYWTEINVWCPYNIKRNKNSTLDWWMQSGHFFLNKEKNRIKTWFRREIEKTIGRQWTCNGWVWWHLYTALLFNINYLKGSYICSVILWNLGFLVCIWSSIFAISCYSRHQTVRKSTYLLWNPDSYN